MAQQLNFFLDLNEPVVWRYVASDPERITDKLAYATQTR
jgi:hypothetical protein